jgi:hypothetical protein
MPFIIHDKPTRPVDLDDNGQTSLGDPSNEGPPPAQVAAPVESGTSSPASAGPGWYPDPEDPAAQRFWDGARWTEARAPIPPPAWARVGTGLRTPPIVALTSVNPDQVPPDPPANTSEPETAVGEVAEAETSADVVIATETDSAKRVVLRSQVDSPGTPRSQEVAKEAHDLDNWAEEAEKAVARAHAVGTSAAWREATQAAIVVSEMAQTMQAAAEAKQTAEQKAQAAKEAAQVAEVASQAAADAIQTAARTAQAAPDAAEGARVAAQAAAAAKHKARELEGIVAKARAANTPAAWSEALQLADAMKTNETSSPTFDRPARPITAGAWFSGEGPV